MLILIRTRYINHDKKRLSSIAICQLLDTMGAQAQKHKKCPKRE